MTKRFDEPNIALAIKISTNTIRSSMDHYNRLLLEVLAPAILIQVPSSSGVYEFLLKHLQTFDVSNKIWDNSILKNRLLNTKYLINPVVSLLNEALKTLLEDKETEEHSILSPFNTKSSLFPNGILSTDWVEKYRTLKPFAFLQTFELPEDVDSDEVLAAKLNDLKNSYAKLNIKFVGIIISDSNNPAEDETRVNKLRQLTGLTRLTGLLYLNTSSADNLDRESELLITGLLSNIKNSAAEFYRRIENSIKQRHKKYYSIPSSNSVDTTIELTPRFLETRNLIKQGYISQFSQPHNLETCIKLFEIAYQNLIEILAESFFEFSKDKISAHDLELYRQLRTLIDIVAFNITRAYLSIEEPIVALKKHAAHISNIVHVTRGRIDVNQWLCIQLKWLAELLQLIPSSILTKSSINNFKKSHKNTKIARFFGGIKLDNGQTEILFNPGLLYMKAMSFLVKSQTSLIPDLDYLKEYPDSESMADQKLELLKLASESVDPEGQHESRGTLRYIYFLLAEEYSSKLDGNGSAIEWYEKAVNLSTDWDILNSSIALRLLECYNSLNQHDEALKIALKLSTGSSVPGSAPIAFDKVTSELSVDTFDFFDINTIFTDSNTCKGEQDDVTVYDALIGQLMIKPRIQKSLLSQFFKASNMSFKINSIKVVFNQLDESAARGLHNIDITHDSSAPNKSLQLVNDSKVNLMMFDNDTSFEYKVIEFSQLVQKSGTYNIETIEIDSCLHLESGDKSVDIRHKDIIDTKKKSGLYNWYYKTLNDNVIKVPVQLKDPLNKTVKVLPVRPNVIVTMKSSSINAIILGEKLSMPFDLQFKNEKKLNYNKLSLSPRIKVVSHDTEDDLSLINPTISWDGLKEDEALVLEDLDKFDLKSTLLHIGIHSTSLHAEEVLKKSNKSYRIVLDLKTLVKEESDDDGSDQSLAIYDTANYELPVLNTPFHCKYAIRPRYREGESNDMPNPFILHDSEHNHLSMPIVTRLWLGYMTLVDKYTEYQGTEGECLEVISTKYTIKSKIPEVVVDVVDPNGDMFQRLFTTKSKNGVSHRNANVIVSATIEWRRSKSQETNTFETEEWEILLPLSDPRVLLQVEKVESQPKSVKFKYVIENPTPRIFSFSTKLIDENERFIWTFEDDRNLLPLQQPKFPVLPFNRFLMEYYGQYNLSGEEVIQLPLFKVYDVQYKVSLPTLPVVNDISIRDNNTLYWETKQ